ncbi:MAG: FAD-dependent oxidoreductase [Acidobacteria bacterium]|nr:FAD-dependent oxidoreductase [Acidobacteriota bacterium]
MGTEQGKPQGPDLEAGVSWDSLVEGVPLPGHAGDAAAVLIRRGEEVFAVGATCTHYGGPLADGIVTGDLIRCPWHHACFSIRTGEVERAPALSPIACFNVERAANQVRVRGKREAGPRVPPARAPESVVIVGAGAAGAACADMLRAQGYGGPVTLVGDEEPGPVDRPNLSKDYLAGNAPEEWIPLRTRDYYESIQVELLIGDAAERIDTSARAVTLRSGRVLPYGALLLATGGEARTLDIEGASLPHVHRLRTLADSRAIIAAAARARRCVVIGASFIGLEVAASLRQRGLEVAVAGREPRPLERVLGPQLGDFVRGLHESHGVRFFLDEEPMRITSDHVDLKHTSLAADLVVMGVGVRPRTELAEAAGLPVDNGIIVDEMLRSGASDVYAAGDVARYPDPISGERVRIEHWAVAERQGQSVARAMLGLGGRYRDPAFFWSQHYDVTISYVGHAPSWDGIELRGDLEHHDACAAYRRGGRVVALATVGRDRTSLAAEAALEQDDRASLERLLAGQ